MLKLIAYAILFLLCWPVALVVGTIWLLVMVFQGMVVIIEALVFLTGVLARFLRSHESHQP